MCQDYSPEQYFLQLMLVEGTILHSPVAKDENTCVMVTELPATIEIRYTITRSFVRYKFVTCLLGLT